MELPVDVIINENNKTIQKLQGLISEIYNQAAVSPENAEFFAYLANSLADVNVGISYTNVAAVEEFAPKNVKGEYKEIVDKRTSFLLNEQNQIAAAMGALTLPNKEKRPGDLGPIL